MTSGIYQITFQNKVYAETRLKQSLALRGKKRTPKQCARIAAGQLGLKHGPMPDAVKEKIRAANTGRVFSTEWRAQISASKRGKHRLIAEDGSYSYV